MNAETKRSCAFTGHRTYRGEADASLRVAIRDLYDRGVDTFYDGMAVGFDLAAAEAVLACRPAMPGLRLVAVVPFAGQELRFGAAERERFRRILCAADERVILSEVYHAGCYARRNDYLVDHAGQLVAWYDGSAGGTRYTVRRALRLGRRVENLCGGGPLLDEPLLPF